MGPALNNLEDLLRMPYGCGEQNMANFAPNIYIMEYLTKTHQVTGDIKNKAENFMEVGEYFIVLSCFTILLTAQQVRQSW